MTFPFDVRRITVAGCSGAGKSSLAEHIAQALAAHGVRHYELDALHHGPGWVPREEFLDDVRAFLGRDAWVCEWQYATARPLILDAADLVIWLDLPKWQVMYQVVRRTISRRLRRVELWNRNVEGPLRTFFTDDEHIVRWAWNSYERTRTRVQEIPVSHPHLPIVRVTSHRQADELVAELAARTDE